MIPVLDLFSAACGGWSLGMHRAGFQTVAACEFVDWRRALYAENNPGVLIYDDVQTLTASRIISDLGYFPPILVGSPPCQDISSANTSGKGVDGERSKLFFEAVRLVGEGRPCWVALENSSNLRTRGADRVIGALEDLGYTVWAFVVSAANVGANHERARAWIVAFDPAQVGHGGWGPWRYGPDGDGAAYLERRFGQHANSAEIGCVARPGNLEGGEGSIDGRFAGDGIGHGRAADVDSGPFAEDGEMGGGAMDGGNADDLWPNWNGGFASHLQLHDGLPAELAGIRVDLGSGKGASAASLIVEAFGDSVVPQIPEAIGRAILRVERAIAYGRA
jgi:DNA (cytosine-5)-methyltransferase 1